MGDSSYREPGYGWGWIGVDLDGTLAEYHGWSGKSNTVGAPIPLMVERVKKWLAAGREVRIFTARVSYEGKHFSQIEVRALIEDFCEEQFGQILPITCTKDLAMLELWDDRAIQVISNTGRRADGKE